MNNKTLLIASSLTLSVLQGCSMTLPVKGQAQNSTETFSGTATGYIDGGGNLKIVSSKGTVCEGNFVYTSSRQGKAREYLTATTSGLGHLSLFQPAVEAPDSAILAASDLYLRSVNKRNANYTPPP